MIDWRNDFRFQKKPGTPIDKAIKKRVGYLWGNSYSGIKKTA